MPLQSGTFEEMLACGKGQSARVEFRHSRTYSVRLTPRRAVLQQRDGEVVRRHVRGRWRRLGSSPTRRQRIVLDRATGRILFAPALGRLVSAGSRRLTSGHKSGYSRGRKAGGR